METSEATKDKLLKIINNNNNNNNNGDRKSLFQSKKLRNPQSFF